MERRKFLRGVIPPLGVALAGCSQVIDSVNKDETTGSTTEGSNETPTPTETPYQNLIQQGEIPGSLPTGDSWGTLRYDPQRTGSALENEGPSGDDPTYRWKVEGEQRDFVSHAPVLVIGEKAIFPNTETYELQARDKRTGKIVWKQEGYGFGAPPIHKDGKLYVTSQNGETFFSVLDVESGEILKTVPLLKSHEKYQPNIIGPVSIFSNKIYYSTRGRVRAIDIETGELLWSVLPLTGERSDVVSRNSGLKNKWMTGITLDAENEQVLCGDALGFVYAFDLKDGTINWAKAFATGLDTTYSFATGERIVLGNTYLRPFAPTVIEGDVLYEIGERTVDSSPKQKQSLPLSSTTTGKLHIEEIQYGSGPTVESADGPVFFRYNAFTKNYQKITRYHEELFNYPTPGDNGWVYFGEDSGLLGGINLKSGDTFVTETHFPENGRVASPIVGKDAVYAIQHHEREENMDVTTVFAVERKTGTLLWSGETPRPVYHLSLANGTLYASGHGVYAIETRE